MKFNGKNTPPKGVLIAVILIILMILIYMFLSGYLPMFFERMAPGK